MANLANVAAALKETFNWWWVGFYRVEETPSNRQLVLGPFQGPVACTRISFGKGVCGTSWAQKATLVVPDVHQFPGHIACSAESNSEIVVPVLDHNGEVSLILDVDSREFDHFDQTDQSYLERVATLLSDKLPVHE
ncbi:GAF domain-containing protein [bacterium SCSIO 12741]|nr:GAF domain-containing protein [bacterium SCSIO 12741]